MKNRKIFIFLAALLAATLLCAFGGFVPLDGILLAPLSVGLLALVLSLAPRPALAPLFWLLPLGAITATGFIFRHFSAVFLGVTLFLTAALIYVCFYKRLSRTVSVIAVSAAFLFGLLTLALFALMHLTDGELSRAAINLQIDKLVNTLTKYMQKALPQEVENLSDAVRSLITSFVVSLPGYFCAVSLLFSYLASGLFRACMQREDNFARAWALFLPRVNAIVYLILLAVSFFSFDPTLSLGLNNVMTVLQMAFALYGFCYFRARFSAPRLDGKGRLKHYYVLVAFLFLIAPVLGAILPSLSPSAGSLASFLLMLPVVSYTVFYIGGLVAAFKTPKKPQHDSK